MSDEAKPACMLCRVPEIDAQLDREEVWRNEHWRLSMARTGNTLGFAYLEPIRHVPYLADLEGEESVTFGPAIAKSSRVLREATGGPTGASRRKSTIATRPPGRRCRASARK